MRHDVWHAGRWEARIGIPGSKHIYLGLFNQEKEAAQAYDRALVRLRGMAAATNFALSDYRLDLAEYHKMQTVHSRCPLPPHSPAFSPPVAFSIAPVIIIAIFDCFDGCNTCLRV